MTIGQLIPELQGQPVAVVFTSLAIILGLYILVCAADWKVFTKMGEKGWKSLIPVYNLYLILKNCSKMKYFAVTIVFAVLAIVLESTAVAVGEVYGNESAWYLVLSLLNLAAQIVLLVVEIKIHYHVSKSFGHGAGFTIGLVFLPLIFNLILGFGKSEYQGNATLAKVTPQADKE